MQIQFTAKSPSITQFVKEYAKAKVQRLERFSDRITSVEMVLSAEKERKIVELIVRTPGHEFVIKEESDDMEASIDAAVDRMEQQLIRFKKKLIDAHRKPREPLAGPLPEEEEEEQEETYQEVVDKTDFSESAEEEKS